MVELMYVTISLLLSIQGSSPPSEREKFILQGVILRWWNPRNGIEGWLVEGMGCIYLMFPKFPRYLSF
jgi:hypothetical protein